MSSSISDLQNTTVSDRVGKAFGRRFLAVALAAVMVLGGGLVVFVAAGSTGVSAQGATPAPLVESECRTGGYFQGAVGDLDQVVEECRRLVRLRNYHVQHPDSVLVSGSDSHPILTWGASGTFIDCADSSCSGWDGVTLESLPGSSGLAVTELSLFDDKSLLPQRLGGEIQANELCGLTRLTSLRLNSNSLSGQIPGCLGSLVNLRTLTLDANRLSGSIPASIAQIPRLNWFSANNNALTGSLPAGFNAAYYLAVSRNSLSGNLPANLGRADGYTVVLDLSDNDFGGAIPSAWTSRFTKIRTFNLADNRLSGASDANWINNWINAIEFVDTFAARPTPLFSLEGNRICYSSAPTLAGNQPRPFDAGGSFTGDYSGIGDFLSRTTSGGSLAVFRLANQACRLGQQSYSNLLMPSPTNEVLNFDSGMINWTWTPPSAGGVNYTPDFHLLELLLDTDLPGATINNGCFPGDRVPIRVTLNSAEDVFPVPQEIELMGEGDTISNIIVFNESPTVFTLTDSSASFPLVLITINPGDEALCRALFMRYSANVIPVHSVSQGGVTNIFIGDSGMADDDPVTDPGWRAFNVTAAGAAKDASQIARDLGVPSNARMFSWDAPNQAWVVHSPVRASGALAAGTAVMFQGGVATEAELAAAGVGRADENIALTLHQGWNLMAPVLADVDGDGDADDFDDRSQAATLFAASLSDCDNTLGVQALVTYNLLTEAFDIHLPCLADVSVPGYGQLVEIDRYDSLFVFFQSQLPAPITWDPVAGQYTPNF